MIQGCIFDMDGVLIDTEPAWRRVERDVFARVGVHLSDEQLRETWGMRIEQVVDHWYQHRPWAGVRPRAVQNAIVREMVDHVRVTGAALPGAVEAVRALRDSGLRIGVASSSSRVLIDAVLERLAIGDLVDAVCTADDEVLGKPDPGVYRSAARLLGLAPEECVAVEDSPAGLQSATAAGMPCVVISPGEAGAQLSGAAVTLSSLHDLTPELVKGLASGDDVSITGRRAE